MAIFAIEGFETREVIIGTSTWVTGRFGAGTAIQFAAASNGAGQVFNAPMVNEFTIGAAHRSAGNTAELKFSFGSANNTGSRVGITAGNEIYFEASGTGGIGGFVRLATSAPLGITPGAWVYIEISVLYHATAGKIKMRLNGATVLDVENVATLQNHTQIGQINSASIYRGGVIYNWDDLYMTDQFDNFQGECNIVGLVPNGNGDSSQFVGSDGNSTDNYLLVDEVPANTTDYVAAEPSGFKDLYQMSNLPGGTTSIVAVRVATHDTKTDSGAKTARTVFKNGGVEGYGATRPVSTSYSTTKEVFDSSPITGNEWTPAEVDAMQVGVEVVT